MAQPHPIRVFGSNPLHFMSNTTSHIVDSSLVNSPLLGKLKTQTQGLSTLDMGSNVFYLLWGKFVAGASSLLVHILGVVRFCTKKQVIWINTAAIIASMKDTLSGEYGSIMDLPRESMGQNSSSIVNADTPVPTTVYRCAPHPTGVCESNLGPESLYCAIVIGRHCDSPEIVLSRVESIPSTLHTHTLPQEVICGG